MSKELIGAQMTLEDKVKLYGEGISTLVGLLFKLKSKSSLIPLTDFTQALMEQIVLYSPVEDELNKVLEIISWNIEFLEYLISNCLPVDPFTTIYWLDNHNELQKSPPYVFIQEAPVTLKTYSFTPEEIGLNEVIPKLTEALESRDKETFAQMLKAITHINEELEMFKD